SDCSSVGAFVFSLLSSHVDHRDLHSFPTRRSSDLGAAPGGWTWVLVRQGLRVIAIDNGPLREHLFDTGLVEHLRADGFRWQPARDRKSTRLNSSHVKISYAVFCLKKKKKV